MGIAKEVQFTTNIFVWNLEVVTEVQLLGRLLKRYKNVVLVISENPSIYSSSKVQGSFGSPVVAFPLEKWYTLLFGQRKLFSIL